MAKRSDLDSEKTGSMGIQGARLEPIRVVERELTSPDGTTVRVRVPVYPPFRLESDESTRAPARPGRRAPRKKGPRRKTG